MTNKIQRLLEFRHTFRGIYLGLSILVACLFFISCNKSDGIIPQFSTSNTGPYILKIDHLRLIDSLRAEDPVINQAYRDLIRGADSLLTVNFTYVPDKNKDNIAPSGDPHDYVSLHRYSYPNDSTGAYTDIIDGKTNPEFYDYDKPKLEKISFSVYALALAYHYTGIEAYAKKASELLKNWFLNPETRMNPNMKYSSLRPGVHEEPGGAGIVGALDFIAVIEAASLIYDSSDWTSDLHYELKKWFFEFYVWMHNKYPADSYSATNISTWLDVQRVIYLLFTEEEDKLNNSRHVQPVSERIENQIEANGLQRYESNRGIPQHYIYFNLKAYMKLSILRKNHFFRTGQDRDWPVLKNCALNSCEAGGLKAALDNIADFIKQEDNTTLFSSDPDFRTCRYLEIFRPAAVAFDSAKYEEIAQILINNGCQNSNILLTYPPLSEL
ncbi:MAG: alginate lyase family protein [Balneolaceae bacterium]|nr:alginate lyase family protein [Balneolaceae bacterium]